MELHGSLADNLRAALASMKRYRGKNVHPDTVQYWEQLLAHAREMVRKGLVGADAAEHLRQATLELLDREGASSVLSR
jgi:hypothetical protein